MRKLLFILTIFVFAGCGTATKVVQVPVRTKILVKERLIPITVKADSATLTALFTCDSTNHVRLKEISELKSKKMQSKVVFKQGRLIYRTLRKTDTIYVHGKDSIIEREVPITVRVPEIHYRQTAIQKFLSIIGGISLLLIIIIAIIKFK